MKEVAWRLWHDMRVSKGVESRDLYGVALEQARWCDERGLTDILTSEHHGNDEVASPFAFLAALGAVTKRARLRAGAVLMPLNDPIRLAEDMILADLVSKGRTEVIIGLGYAVHEYAMFGTAAKTRGRETDDRLPPFLACLEGREFRFGSRHGTVRPSSYQSPRPPVLLGGSVPASARRAARFGDGFAPTTADPELRDLYWAECDKIGRARGVWKTPWHPVYVHVTDDPERDWALIGPHIVDETNMYQQWNDEAASAATGKTVRTEPMTDWAPIRASNYYAVVTPDELITILNEQPDGAATIACKPLRIAPLVDMGWSSLELIVDKVLPNFQLVEPAPIAVPIPLLAEDMV